MNETITIISAIISVVMLIVFFIMAYNISKMAKDVKLLKQVGFLFMNGSAITTNRCNGCNEDYFSRENDREYCPHCGYLNLNKKKV